MTTESIVIVGNGRMAQNCAEILLARSATSVRLVVAEDRADAPQARLAQFCRRHDVQLLRTAASINDPATVANIAARRPDFIFSINNYQLFGAELLTVPARGCINFHNGPIERYRGVQIPSWAIANGETEHGVTWHYMERAVDAGAIAAAATFPLTGAETALSLTLECIRVGIDVFARELERILSGERKPAPSLGRARCYRRRDLPNDGVLELSQPATHIDRLLRATDFRPLPNPFTYARLRCPRGDLIVNAAKAVGENVDRPPGEIVAAGERLIVTCADRLLELTAVMLQPDEPTTVASAIAALDLKAGQRLT